MIENTRAKFESKFVNCNSLLYYFIYVQTIVNIVTIRLIYVVQLVFFSVLPYRLFFILINEHHQKTFNCVLI